MFRWEWPACHQRRSRWLVPSPPHPCPSNPERRGTGGTWLVLLGLNPRGPTPQPTCSYQPRGCTTRSRLEHVQLLNRPKLCWRRWPTKPCLNLGHGDGGWQAPMAATGLTCSWRDPSWRCGRQHPRALSNPWDTARKTFNFNNKKRPKPLEARGSLDPIAG